MVLEEYIREEFAGLVPMDTTHKQVSLHIEQFTGKSAEILRTASSSPSYSQQVECHSLEN